MQDFAPAMKPRDFVAAQCGARKWGRGLREVAKFSQENGNPKFLAMMERLHSIEKHMYPLPGSEELPPNWDTVTKNVIAIVTFFYIEEKGLWDVFAELGGPEILMELLTISQELHHRYEGKPANSEAEQVAIASAQERIQEVQTVCLSVLYKSCYSTFYVADRLAVNQDNLILLFDLMKTKSLFEAAVSVLQELLLVRDDTFPLEQVKDFNKLVQSLERAELAYFCRVLTLVMFEPEEKAHMDSLNILKSRELLQLRKSLSGSTVKNTDKNHSILLNCPRFLESLVQLIATQANSASIDLEFPSQLFHQEGSLFGLRIEIDFIMQFAPVILGTTEFVAEDSDWLEAFRSLNRMLATSRGRGGSLENQPSGINYFVGTDTHTIQSSRETTDTEANPSREDCVVMKHQVQVLFAICTLLGGRRKADAQAAFERVGLIEALTNLGERIDWKSRFDWNSKAHRSAASYTSPHGPGCDCNPESAIISQFLRLVHHLCDREGDLTNRSRLLLLTDAVVDDEDIHGPMETQDGMDRGEAKSPTAPGEENRTGGLLKVVLNILLSQPLEISYRIGLASSIEAYLRGGGTKDQIVFAESGLLKYLLSEISQHSTDGADRGNSSSLQTCFDLLGELCKFNREVFQLLEEEMQKEEELLGKLFTVATNNLVDSNVFIRSAVLSLERFRMEDAEMMEVDTDHNKMMFKGSRLWTFLVPNRYQLLFDLTNIVQAEEINQENICCLNTAVVLFIFESLREPIDQIVGRLQKMAKQNNLTNFESNLRNLLDLWQDYYYCYRGVDVLSIEHSSNICFSVWSETVESLQKTLRK